MNAPQLAPSRRRWVHRALVALACVALVELTAQAIAWRVWSSEWIGPSGAPDGSVVLLVGAGETFDEGVRLRADAWPAAVAREFDGSDGLRVVPGAAPGRDSSDVLRRLPLQLTLERPGLVVACVGVEDFRRRAAHAVRTADLPGRNAPFPLRLRLAGGFADAVAPGGDAAGGVRAPFVGPWHFGDLAFRFEPDGTLWMGDAPTRWSFDDGRLTVAVPGSAPFDVDWALEGDRLELTGDFPGEHVVLFRGRPLASAAARGAQALAEGRWDEAEWMLRPAVLGPQRAPDAAATLVELCVRAGRRAEAEALAAELATRPDAPAVLRARARAEIALGTVDAAVARIVGGLADAATDELLVAALRGLPAGAAADRVADAAATALDGAPPDTVVPLAWIATDLLARAGRARAAAHTLARGLAAVDGEPDPREVPVLVRVLDDAGFARAVEGLPAWSAARVAAHREVLAEADRQTAAVLRGNLEVLIEVARFHDAEVVLVDPDDDPAASAVRRAVAERTGVRSVPCAATRAGLAGAVREVIAGHLRR